MQLQPQVESANEVGVEYSKQNLRSATDFIWKIFQQKSAADRKNVSRVTLFIEETGTYNSDNEIHMSADYIANYSGGDVRTEITGYLYHIMTHIWQWEGTSQAPVPGGLLQGIGDFVRLKAGYVPSSGWVPPGQGDRWDQGYDVTAWFLDYCDGMRNGFVAELNKKMRNGYSPNYFVELMGKADQLWSDYKAEYNTPANLIVYCEA